MKRLDNFIDMSEKNDITYILKNKFRDVYYIVKKNICKSIDMNDFTMKTVCRTKKENSIFGIALNQSVKVELVTDDTSKEKVKSMLFDIDSYLYKQLFFEDDGTPEDNTVHISSSDLSRGLYDPQIISVNGVSGREPEHSIRYARPLYIEPETIRGLTPTATWIDEGHTIPTNYYEQMYQERLTQRDVYEQQMEQLRSQSIFNTEDIPF